MKSIAYCLIVTLLLAISGSAGCSKKINVDTTQLDYIQPANEATQKALTDGIEAIERADYTAAADSLKKVAADPQLTAEQKTAVNTVISQIEQR